MWLINQEKKKAISEQHGGAVEVSTVVSRNNWVWVVKISLSMPFSTTGTQTGYFTDHHSSHLFSITQQKELCTFWTYNCMGLQALGAVNSIQLFKIHFTGTKKYLLLVALLFFEKLWGFSLDPGVYHVTILSLSCINLACWVPQMI